MTELLQIGRKGRKNGNQAGKVGGCANHYEDI